MKRTFIAIKVNTTRTLYDVLDNLKAELKNESVRWVDAGKMHITLAFLGDTSEESIRDVSVMLREKCSGYGRFDFILSGIGVFKTINDPKVIWAGIGNSEKLAELFQKVKDGLEEIGIKTEERDFKPHLTLGRIKWIKDKISLEGIISKFRVQEFQVVTVDEVIFYESILQQTGPLYLPIKVIKLTK